MNSIKRFARRLSNLAQRRHTDEALDTEIQLHRAFLKKEYIDAGSTPEDADAKAQREIGNLSRIREDYREQRGFPSIEAFWNDIGFACRSLFKRPLLLLTTSLSIAVGAGLNIGVFSILSDVLFHTSLSGVKAADHMAQILGVSFPNYQDLRTTQTFDNSAAFEVATLVWRNTAATSTVNAKVVSANFFDLADVKPLRGRTFHGNDAQSVVLGFGFWQRQFASNPDIVGQSMNLNGWPFLIVGVLPKTFNAPLFPFVVADVYVPITHLVCGGLTDRASAQFDLIVRLPKSMPMSTAETQLQRAAAQLARRFPKENSRLPQFLTLSAMSGIDMWEHMGAGSAMFIAFGSLYLIVGLILLVTCANVAGLLLSRAEERRRETAVCVALGASRWRLMQRFAAESAVIATLGCLIGTFLYAAITTAGPKWIWSATNVTLVLPSVPFIYCCVLIAAITIACGFLPSLTVSQVAPTSALVAASPRMTGKASLAQRLLVIAQVAVCFLLLTGSSLLLRTAISTRHTAPGFDVEHTMAVNVQLPADSIAQGNRFDTLRETIRHVPGIIAVSCVRYFPLRFATWRAHIRTDEKATLSQSAAADIFPVGPGYLATMRIPLMRGRDLNDSDMGHATNMVLPVVVNATLAQRFFRSANPLGRRLVLLGDGADHRDQPLEIVGVAQDSKLRSLNEDPHPVVFFPELSTSFVVRVSGLAASSLQDIEKAVARNQPGAAVQATAMTTQIANARLPVEIGGGLLSLLGMLGLLLSMTGLYGVMSYAVTRRTFEIGVRVALGARRNRVAASVVRESLAIVLAGCALGLIFALSLAKIVSPLLAAGQHANDPTILGLVASALLSIGCTASLVPALRAASIDPLQALRHE